MGPSPGSREMDRFPRPLVAPWALRFHDWRNALCNVTSPMADLIVQPI